MDQHTQVVNELLSKIGIYKTIYEAGNFTIDEFFRRVNIEEIKNQVEEASRNKIPISPLINGIYDFYLAFQSKKKANPIQFDNLKNGISDLNDLHKSIEEAKQNAEQHIIIMTEEHKQEIQKVKQEAEIDKQQEIIQLRDQNLQYSQALHNFEVDKKLDKKGEVKTQIQQLIKENKQLKEKCRTEETKTKNFLELQEKYDKAKARMKALDAEISDKENMISNYKRVITAKDNLIATKEKMISTRDKKIVDLTKKNSSASQTNQSNSKRLHSNDTKTDFTGKQEFQQLISNQADEIQRLNSQVDYLRRELQNVGVKRTSEINQDNQLPDQNIDTPDQNVKSSKNAMQQDEIKALKTEITNLKKMISQKETYINELKQDSINKDKQNDKIINNYKLQLAEKDNKYLQISQLYEKEKINISAKEHTIQVLAKEKETFLNQNKINEQQISTLRTNIANMTNGYERMKNENTYIRSEYEKIKGAANQYSALQSENTTIKSENITLKSENTALKSENTALKSENSGFKREITTLKSENTNLRSENTTLKSENTALKSGNTALKSENSGLKSENTTLKSENFALKNENTNLKSENSALKNENATLKRENADLKSGIDKLVKDNRKLNEKLEKANAKEKEILIATITQENTDLKQTVSDLENTSQTQKEKISNIAKEKTDLEAQVRKLTQDYSDLEKIKKQNDKLIKSQKEIINKQMILAKIENEKQIRRMKYIQQREINSIIEAFNS